MSPEVAADLMKIVGTLEGEKSFPHSPYMKANSDGKPTFNLLERLDKFVLRHYSSKSTTYRSNQIQKALKRLLQWFMKTNSTNKPE